MHGEMHGEMQWYRYSTTVLRYGGMHGEMQGKYYRYCSRSIRYSTDLNSENNKFDMETFDLVSEYCRAMLGILRDLIMLTNTPSSHRP